MITFMDSLLQTLSAAMPFRKMMVPVMIKQLRCDPKVLYEGLSKNKIAEQRDLVGTVSDDAIEDIIYTKLDGKDARLSRSPGYPVAPSRTGRTRREG